MKDFKDKVAVVTGAASGIGRALAGKCAQEGMKVVLADVEERALKGGHTWHPLFCAPHAGTRQRGPYRQHGLLRWPGIEFKPGHVQGE